MKNTTSGKIAAVVVAGAVLAAVGFAVFSNEATAFGPKHGGTWFGPNIELSETQRLEIAKIYGAGGPMRGKRDMDRVLDSLGENPDAKVMAVAREKLEEKFYEDMKTRYQAWRVLTEEQRKTIETRMKGNSANREKKGMLDQEAFVRYIDKVCYLSPAQENALALQKPEDLRKEMGKERLALLGEKMNLTEDQKKKLSALFEKTGEQNGPKEGKVKGLRLEENARLMNASVFDEKLAHEIASGRAENMISRYIARQGFHKGILDILTDEQKKQLDEFVGPVRGIYPFHRAW